MENHPWNTQFTMLNNDKQLFVAKKDFWCAKKHNQGGSFQFPLAVII